MITYRDNGEHWYCDRRSLWKRARQWLIWFGGWEQANGAGWQLRWRGRGFYSPTPVSILGHRATFFGDWFQVRRSGDWLVVRLRRGYTGGPYAFLSRDGTPSGAHHWLFGAPARVRRAAEQRHPSAE